MSQQHLLLEDDASRKAALNLSSFIVEAPAGAGKTELLTQRFLKLLQTVQAPEEIIAITFTNKAASEMKSRIMDSLEMAASATPPSLPHKVITFELGLLALKRSAELNWNLLETPSRLRIYTIDSLSGNLARQMPLLSRFGTQPAVRDDASSYYQEAAARTLENIEAPGVGEIVQTALRYFDNDTYKLTDLLSSMLARRDQWLPYTQSTNAAQAAEAALTHMIIQELQAIAEVMSSRTQTTLMPIARYAASNLPDDGTLSALLDWDTPLQPSPETLPMWGALGRLLLTGSGTLRKSLNKNIGFPATDESKPIKEALLEVIEALHQTPSAEAALARIKLLPNPAHDEDAWKIIATLSQLLHIAASELWLVFQTHGTVDFVEISQRSLLALEDTDGNATDLALRLDYRIQHLLVDEFQDTSPMQVNLIQALTQGWQADDGRTLFAVGDPMQSIYRFRKANVGLFLKAEQRGIGDLMLTPLKLWRNNRSTPPVVDWVNKTFKVVFPEKDDSTKGAIQYRPFVATKNEETGAGVFVHAILDADIEEHDSRQQEADKIIQIILDTWQQDPKRKIAVLVRARSHLHALVAEIRRNHPTLSFQAVEVEELANRQIVQDLLSLTHALHQRADRVHWLAILRAPWCGLTLADLHALAAHNKHSTVLELMHDEIRLQTLSEDGQVRLKHLRGIMQQALDNQGRMSTSRWLHGVWLMLGGAECLWDANDVSDVQAFFERIQQLENAHQFSPEQLIIEVEKLYAAPDALAPDTLQFMTIHKSKGLEFDTVILPGLDRRTGNNEQPLLLWEEVPIDNEAENVELIVAPLIPKGHQAAPQQSEQATPYDYLKILEKQRGEYEDARVLYVAATRAERCLHLLGVAKIDNKSGEAKAPKNTFLEMLWPVVQHQFTPEFALKTEVSTQTNNTDMSLQDFAPQLVRLQETKIPAPLKTPAPSTIVNKNVSAESDAKKSEDNNTLDADVGILSHVYMELIANSNIEKWHNARITALKPAMQRWFKQQGYDANKSLSGATRVNALLSTTLVSEQGQWLLHAKENSGSELIIESLNTERVEKKIVDRTFTENGTRWIVDYKSMALDTNISITENALKSIAEQYREQLEGYEKLFASEGLPIQKAIFFLSIGKLVLI